VIRFRPQPTPAWVGIALIPAAVIAAVAAVVSPGSAEAGSSGKYVSEPGTTPPEPLYVPRYREAPQALVGFDVGIGIIGGLCSSCESTLGGIALDGYAGVLVTPTVAALAEVSTVLHLLPTDEPSNSGLLTHSLATANARVWASPVLWFQGGLGLGNIREHATGSGASDYALAFAFAFGGELDHTPSRGIDLALRYALARYQDDNDEDVTIYNLVFTVGWHWY
jgi:hypothetical protein